MSQATSEDRTDVLLLCGIERGLTPWEIQFAEDPMKKAVERGHPLTPRQRECMDKILERFEL